VSDETTRNTSVENRRDIEITYQQATATAVVRRADDFIVMGCPFSRLEKKNRRKDWRITCHIQKAALLSLYS
jgi:hypothetical protein